MTADERKRMLDQTRQVADYGHLPGGPVNGLPGVVAPPEQDPDLFTLDDLLRPQERAQPYTIPGTTKRVWVHPLTIEEAAWVNAQAIKEVRALKLEDELVAQQERIYRARVYQVSMACRSAKTPGSPRVFDPTEQTIRALRNNLTAETVRLICVLSDSLGASDSDEYQLIVDFFATAETLLSTCASQLSTDSLESWRAALHGFASCASAIRQSGTFTTNHLEALKALLPVE